MPDRSNLIAILAGSDGTGTLTFGQSVQLSANAISLQAGSRAPRTDDDGELIDPVAEVVAQTSELMLELVADEEGESSFSLRQDAQISDDVDGIRSRLIAQLSEPVRWADCASAIASSGVTSIIECGPGKVLTGLQKRINRDITGLNIATADGFTATLQATS